jgi:hypothetical protein
MRSGCDKKKKKKKKCKGPSIFEAADWAGFAFNRINVTKERERKDYKTMRERSAKTRVGAQHFRCARHGDGGPSGYPWAGW